MPLRVSSPHVNNVFYFKTSRIVLLFPYLSFTLQYCRERKIGFMSQIIEAEEVDTIVDNP